MKKFYCEPEAELIEIDAIFTDWTKESGGEVPTGGSGSDYGDIGEIIDG